MADEGTATEAVEELIAAAAEQGATMEEIVVDPEVLRRLEAELAPLTPEEYWGIPVHVLVRH